MSQKERNEELARLIALPPVAEDPDPKVRETKRTCPCCLGAGLVTPLVAAAYRAAFGGVDEDMEGGQ